MNKMIIAALTALLACGSALAADANPNAAADSKCEAAAIDLSNELSRLHFTHAERSQSLGV